METYSYEYATSKNYTFPKYKGRDGLVAMKDLFNMTAGTSTGSILAAGLAYPNENRIAEKEPKFFANDLLKIYSERGNEIFVKKTLGGGAAFFYLLCYLVVFGGLSWWLGSYLYDNKKVEESLVEMQHLISNHKRELKN